LVVDWDRSDGSIAISLNFFGSTLPDIDQKFQKYQKVFINHYPLEVFGF